MAFYFWTDFCIKLFDACNFRRDDLPLFICIGGFAQRQLCGKLHITYGLSHKELVFRGFFNKIVVITMFSGGGLITNRKLLPVRNILRRLLSTAEASDAIKKIRISSPRLLSQVTTESVRMASVMVVTLPILVLYPFLQKYFIKGVMIGSIKE